MINTKLILLEGPPGSGKTTISKKLFERINVKNKDLFQESAEPHPIAENDIADDMDIWPVKTLSNWEKLSADLEANQKLVIMEFAWFQNTIGMMLINDCGRHRIMALCRQIEQTIKAISPVLILYTADNDIAFLKETYELRRDEGWPEDIDGLIEKWPYGQQRNLKGFAGFSDFYQEYVSIMQTLYAELEIERITIDVTQREWPKVENLTYEYLQI